MAIHLKIQYAGKNEFYPANFQPKRNRASVSQAKRIEETLIKIKKDIGFFKRSIEENKKQIAKYSELLSSLIAGTATEKTMRLFKVEINYSKGIKAIPDFLPNFLKDQIRDDLIKSWQQEIEKVLYDFEVNGSENPTYTCSEDQDFWWEHVGHELHEQHLQLGQNQTSLESLEQFLESFDSASIF